MSNRKARVIAFYLPQFHPIPENDEWWGKGFTEWTNVGKAKPLFKNHYQPRVPADLGYYDLRMPEIREAQAKMAQDAGVEGFMYWHYWFGNGKRLLAGIFDDVLKSGKPNFPFCLGWANHSWYAKNWNASDAKKDKLLIEQLYPGVEDYTNHFYTVLKAFQDKRYINVDDKPLFYFYSPYSIPNLDEFISLWQRLALENGLKGIHFVAQTNKNYDCEKLLNLGFDGVCRSGISDAADQIKGKMLNKVLWHLRQRSKYVPLNIYDYAEIIEHLSVPELDKINNVYPTIIPNFDHSPRSKRRGLIYTNSNPGLFKQHINQTLQTIQEKQEDHKIVFLRSWNEWAEGNYVEPDLLFGHGYLQALKDEILGH